MSREAVEKRRPLTRKEVITLCLRQNGRCGCGCGFKLDAMGEGVIDEHVLMLETLGSNDLENRALYRKPCAVKKTKAEAPIIAKVRRLAGETCAGPTKRPLQSRGFGDRSRKFNGEVSPTRRASRSGGGE